MLEFKATRQQLSLRSRRPFVEMTPSHVEVHHSVYGAAAWPALRQIAEIDRLHYDEKQWNGIFYQVGIDVDSGDLYELRGIGNQSTPSAPTALTCVFLGDLRTDRVSDAAKTTLYHLAAEHGGVRKVTGHQERPYATACPGFWGMDTVTALRSGSFIAGEPLDTHYRGEPLLSPGDANFVVAGLQIHMTTLGFYFGRVDSRYGPETMAAVERFEAATHQPVDGLWHQADQQALVEGLAFLEHLGEKAKAEAQAAADLQPFIISSQDAQFVEPLLPEPPTEKQISDFDQQLQAAIEADETEKGPDPEMGTETAPAKQKRTVTSPSVVGLLTAVIVGALSIGAGIIGLEGNTEQLATIGAAAAASLIGFVTKLMHDYTNGANNGDGRSES